MFFRTLFFTKRPLRLVNDYPQLWLLFLVLLIKEISLVLSYIGENTPHGRDSDNE